MTVKQAQTKRAEAYSSWEQAFQIYLADPDAETVFGRSCSKAQDELQVISLLVNEQSALLKASNDCINWVAELQELQNLERRKLELTVKRIMTRWKCKYESSEELKPRVEHQDLQLRRELAEIIEEINGIITNIDFELYDLL